MDIITNEQLRELTALAAKRKEEILNTPSVYPLDRPTYYVDSENGSDENDGKSPETAWRSLPRVDVADLNEGDVVLFKRGQKFRGSMRSVSGVTYSAYGEGAKPELLCSIDASSPDLWVPTRWENVWMFVNLISYVRDIGAVVINDGECWGIKVYKNCKTNERVDMYRTGGRRGDCHGELDVWNGRRWVHRECTIWNGPEDLKSDLEFYHDWSAERLYLYCPDGNPGKAFERIELSVRYSTFRNLNNDNVTVDNLAFKCAGIHAIASSSCRNFTVRNCEFAFLGGSLMNVEAHARKEENIAYGDDPTRLGNAIEIYGTCDGYLVENNYIRQIYDTGITVQYNGGSTLTRDLYIQNVEWRNNLIDTCHWSLELWLYVPKERGEFDAAYRNIDIHDNICINNGYGWGRQRPDKYDTAFSGGGGMNSCNPDFENYVIRDNIFLNAKSSLLSTISFGDDGIHVVGNKLYTDSSIGSFGGDLEFRKSPPSHFSATDENLERLENCGWWQNNEFKKLNKPEDCIEPFVKF